MEASFWHTDQYSHKSYLMHDIDAWVMWIFLKSENKPLENSHMKDRKIAILGIGLLAMWAWGKPPTKLLGPHCPFLPYPLPFTKKVFHLTDCFSINKVWFPQCIQGCSIFPSKGIVLQSQCEFLWTFFNTGSRGLWKDWIILVQ